MPDTVLEGLQLANRHVSEALARLQREGLSAIQHGWFAAVRAYLSQGDACLHRIGLDRPLPPPLQTEVSQYQNHLQALGQILPILQGRLLAERARVQTARERQQSLQAWADAQRSTF